LHAALQTTSAVASKVGGPVLRRLSSNSGSSKYVRVHVQGLYTNT